MAEIRTRFQVDLNGRWERRVNGLPFDVIPVPSSQRPLGNYELGRSFRLPRLEAGQRAFLCFDAITYYGRVKVNGVDLGAMGPYVPYEFEFTSHAREGQNEVSVTIADAASLPNGEGRDELAIGLNPGWEGAGGIIRDVRVDLRPASFIDNVRFGYNLADKGALASCEARVHLSSRGSAGGQLEVALRYGNSEAARVSRQVNLVDGLTEAELRFDIRAPLLWSPERPNLYTLEATLRTGPAADRWACRTGFRDFGVRGRQFYLNGQPVQLHGVCRHDMWKDQGFTLTREQMRQDMQMIKAMGANFVRLVHYPHHRYIVDLADELGLLVTEEPGYWQVEFPSMPRSTVETGLRILERAIRRDWNSPSVCAWFLGNESRLTVEYLREGKELCNRLDPLRRPVSFANDSDMRKAKAQFDEAGLDFYSHHLYGFSEDKFERTADYYGESKPLVIDEWGWEVVAGDQIVYERDFDRMLRAMEAGKIAGHAFWSWQDVREYSRIDWPTQNGILLSGVVDEARTPRPGLYTTMARLCQGRPQRQPPAPAKPEIVPLRVLPWTENIRTQPLNLQKVVESPAAQKAWSELEASLAEYWAKSKMARNQWQRTGRGFHLWKSPELAIGGVRFLTPLVNGYVRPLVLTAGTPEFEIPVDLNCARLHILGQVTLPSGYPLEGRPGEAVAAYTLRFAGGRSTEVQLRNGLEVTRANLIHDATRINPMAAGAPRALIFAKDAARENYQFSLYSLATGGRLTSLRCRWNGGTQALVIAAITAELA